MCMYKNNILKIIYYWIFGCLFRLPLHFDVMPINLTLSVTNRCNAKCRTCNIWKIYIDNPDLVKQELDLGEWESILKSIGSSPVWITISGGNQFLRNDLVTIIGYAVKYCRPSIINIPVSGILPEKIYAKTEEILEICKKNKVRLIMNVSLDGINEKQDEIRGFRGAFTKTIETYRKLQELRDRYNNFSVGVYTVISEFNVNNIPVICDLVYNNLKPDTYAIEIAEPRKELGNLFAEITPTAGAYRDAVNYYQKKFEKKNDGILYLKQLMRRRYYFLIEKGTKVPCRAGIISAQISPYGNVWPCCTRAEVMGNLKETGYDFRKVWFSRKAAIIRSAIKKRSCYCTHSNPYYTNMLFHPKSLMDLCLDFLKHFMNNL